MQKRRPITQHLLSSLERPKDWIALSFKRHKKWIKLNWREYFERCEALAHALADLDIQRGDRVAILSNSRAEWAYIDFAILGLGAVTVPIYQSNRPDEIEDILLNAEPRVLFVENLSQLRKWESVAKKCKFVEHVICLDILPDDEIKNALSFDELLNRGVDLCRLNPEFFAHQIHRTELSDIATIVYTSGTTGSAKGAVITHEQILSEVEDVTRALPITNQDSTLTFLPFAHVMGRVELWLHTFVGFTLNFAESVDRLKPNLIETKPTVIIGVPRIFEKIYSGLLTQIEGHPLRKRLFDYLGTNPGRLTKLIAEKALYSKLRDGLGGRLRFVVSGGAPLEPKLAQFFKEAGVVILEAYGLTETTAAITLNTPDNNQIGSVGRPLHDVDIKIASDGEILVRSKKIFKEYFRDPQSTSNAFQGEYFCTGDVGELTDRGYLRITDRKKDLIKTSGGKYVAPQKLEGLLKLSPLISQVLIHGDRRKYVVALTTLNEPYLKTLARERAWVYRDYRALTQLPQVSDLVRKHVAQINSQLASYETIKNFAILSEDFSIERGELTPSLKVKRRVLDEKYKDVIEDLYR